MIAVPRPLTNENASGRIVNCIIAISIRRQPFSVGRAPMGTQLDSPRELIRTIPRFCDRDFIATTSKR